MHIVANEPSLAFYRLQEHVRKSLPPMVEHRVEVIKLHRELQGHCYDVEYAVRYERQCSTMLFYLQTSNRQSKLFKTTALFSLWRELHHTLKISKN